MFGKVLNFFYEKIKSKVFNYRAKRKNEILREHGCLVGSDVSFGRNVTLSVSGEAGKVKIGDNVHIGTNSFIRGEGGLKVGNNVIISRNVVIYSTSHNYEGTRLPFDDTNLEKAVEIGDNVWIGVGVTIVPGTKIGEGAVIGMGACLHGEIPPLSVVGFNPPKIIKQRKYDRYEKLKNERSFCGADGEAL